MDIMFLFPRMHKYVKRKNNHKDILYAETTLLYFFSK